MNKVSKAHICGNHLVAIKIDLVFNVKSYHFKLLVANTKFEFHIEPGLWNMFSWLSSCIQASIDGCSSVKHTATGL